jgi:hypothetical protein
MLNKHRNALLALIKAAGLDPKLFARSEAVSEDHKSFTIRLRACEDLYFLVRAKFQGADYAFDYECAQYFRTPPFGHPAFRPEKNPYYHLRPFDDTENAFKTWLTKSAQKYLAVQAEELEDRNTPDLWAEIDLPAGSSEDLQALPNTEFSADEQTRIAKALYEFEEKITNEENFLLENQIHQLHKHVEYLIAASKRMGRKDWVMTATGALFSYTLQVGLSGDKASQLLQLAAGGLQWIVVHLPLLPPASL